MAPKAAGGMGNQRRRRRGGWKISAEGAGVFLIFDTPKTRMYPWELCPDYRQPGYFQTLVFNRYWFPNRLKKPRSHVVRGLVGTWCSGRYTVQYAGGTWVGGSMGRCRRLRGWAHVGTYHVVGLGWTGSGWAGQAGLVP
eukprot:gene9646-biopygen10753